MASWKKYFKPAPVRIGTHNNTQNISNQTPNAITKDAAWLPEYYSGSQDRIVRYSQYDQMDSDHEVNLALTTIAEFCTQFDDDLSLPFKIEWNEEPVGSEVTILAKILRKWSDINNMRKRAFKLFRSTIKYGDQFFIRDPETFELHWVDPTNIKHVIVNEADHKNIVFYAVTNLSINLEAQVGSDLSKADISQSNMSVQQWSKPNKTNYAGHSGDSVEHITYVEADHVLHISLDEGMSSTWPFGTSELEKIFKIFKQKELLEDAILIYRIHRAPERRVFFIDVGDLPPHRAKAHLEQVKLEVQQKRIPNQSADGTNSVMDSTYNPLSTMEDYFFAQNRDGRGSRVDTLSGGEGLGEISDLKYFNNKMIRGLSIPSAYLPTGPEDGTSPYTDGKVGTAFIQEYRFDRYCKRLQQILIDELDHEFKMYAKFCGINIDSSTFRLEFNTPQNFSNYREVEMNTAFASAYAQMADYEHMSKRMTMKKYLGWSEKDILENERLWKEEHGIVNDESDAVAKMNDTRLVGASAVKLKQYIDTEREKNE